WGSRGGSQVGAMPVAQVPQGLVGEGIHPALGDVALELAVPVRGVELGEPGAQRDEVFVGELADRGLDLIDSAHRGSISLAADRSNGRRRLSTNLPSAR